MSTRDKPLVWLEGEILTPPFSASARIEADYLLRRLQKGERLSLPHSRPMSSIGAKCHELRIVDDDKVWRVVYRIDTDAILILDVFQKKTRKTPQSVIANAESGSMKVKEEMGMNNAKKKRLEARGFKVGSVEEFLNLSPEEAAYIELKFILGKRLQDYRKARRFTQTELARRIKSSQSRVAKMEAGDPSVSIDLLIRSLFALGASRKHLADMVA